MVRSSGNYQRGFTLIELLTVIAIIAILTAILFPVAGTVREQARATDCMSKLHQLWVSANVYRQDEGAFPPSLLGYAEAETATGLRVPWDPSLNLPVVPAANIHLGSLFREEVRDLNVYRCPDNQRKDPREVVTAWFPPRPSDWPRDPQGNLYIYIGDVLATAGCQTNAVLGTQFCNPGNNKAPYYFYAVDSYDISPAIDPVTGAQILDSTGAIGYHVRYTRDWTGVVGANDMPMQLKYENPPDDKTLFTFCSWHQAVAHTGTVPAISMGGTAKKINLTKALTQSASLFAR